MAKPPKTVDFQIGDVVFHRASTEHCPGVVIGLVARGPLGEVEVDWGPQFGCSIHYEFTLTDTYVPKFEGG